LHSFVTILRVVQRELDTRSVILHLHQLEECKDDDEDRLLCRRGGRPVHGHRWLRRRHRCHHPGPCSDAVRPHGSQRLQRLPLGRHVRHLIHRPVICRCLHRAAGCLSASLSASRRGRRRPGQHLRWYRLAGTDQRRQRQHRQPDPRRLGCQNFLEMSGS